MVSLTETGPIDCSDVSHEEVLYEMAAHGGSFVSRLALAWRHADLENSAILLGAFSKYYRQYQENVACRKSQRASRDAGAHRIAVNSMHDKGTNSVLADLAADTQPPCSANDD